MPFAFDIRYISLSKAEGTKIGSRIRDSEERGRKHGYRPSLFESSNSVVLRPCVSLLVNKNKYRLEARPLHDDDHQNHGRGGLHILGANARASVARIAANFVPRNDTRGHNLEERKV